MCNRIFPFFFTCYHDDYTIIVHRYYAQQSDIFKHEHIFKKERERKKLKINFSQNIF